MDIGGDADTSSMRRSMPRTHIDTAGKQAKIPGFPGFFLLKVVQLSLNLQSLNMGIVWAASAGSNLTVMLCGSGHCKPNGFAVGNSNCIHDPRQGLIV